MQELNETKFKVECLKENFIFDDIEYRYHANNLIFGPTEESIVEVYKKLNLAYKQYPHLKNIFDCLVRENQIRRLFILAQPGEFMATANMGEACGYFKVVKPSQRYLLNGENFQNSFIKLAVDSDIGTLLDESIHNYIYFRNASTDPLAHLKRSKLTRWALIEALQGDYENFLKIDFTLIKSDPMEGFEFLGKMCEYKSRLERGVELGKFSALSADIVFQSEIASHILVLKQDIANHMFPRVSAVTRQAMNEMPNWRGRYITQSFTNPTTNKLAILNKIYPASRYELPASADFFKFIEQMLLQQSGTVFKFRPTGLVDIEDVDQFAGEMFLKEKSIKYRKPGLPTIKRVNFKAVIGKHHSFILGFALMSSENWLQGNPHYLLDSMIDTACYTPLAIFGPFGLVHAVDPGNLFDQSQTNLTDPFMGSTLLTIGNIEMNKEGIFLNVLQDLTRPLYLPIHEACEATSNYIKEWFYGPHGLIDSPIKFLPESLILEDSSAMDLPSIPPPQSDEVSSPPPLDSPLPEWQYSMDLPNPDQPQTRPSVLPPFRVKANQNSDFIPEDDQDDNRENTDTQNSLVEKGSSNRFYYETTHDLPNDENRVASIIEGIKIEPGSIEVRYGGNSLSLSGRLKNGIRVNTNFILAEAGYGGQITFSIPFTKNGADTFASKDAQNQKSEDMAELIRNIFRAYEYKKAKRHSKHLAKHVERFQETIQSLNQYLSENTPLEPSLYNNIQFVDNETNLKIKQKFEESKAQLTHDMRRSIKHCHHYHKYGAVDQMREGLLNVNQSELLFQNDTNKKELLQHHSGNVSRENADLPVEDLITKFMNINNSYLSHQNSIEKAALFNLITEKIIQENRLDLVLKYSFLQEWNVGIHLELPPVAIPKRLHYGQVRAPHDRGIIVRSADKLANKILKLYTKLNDLIGSDFNHSDQGHLNEITKCYNELMEKSKLFEEKFSKILTRGSPEYSTFYSHYEEPITTITSKAKGLYEAVINHQNPPTEYISSYVPQQKFNNQELYKIAFEQHLEEIKNNFIHVSQNLETDDLINLAAKVKEKKNSDTLTKEDEAKKEALDSVIVERACKLLYIGDIEGGLNLFENTVEAPSKYFKVLENLFEQMQGSLLTANTLIELLSKDMSRIISSESNLNKLGGFFEKYFTNEDILQNPKLIEWKNSFNQWKAALGFIKGTLLTINPRLAVNFWLLRIKESCAALESDPNDQFHSLLSIVGNEYIKDEIQQLLFQHDFYPAFNILMAYERVINEADKEEINKTLILFKGFEKNLHNNVPMSIWINEFKTLLASTDKQSYLYTTGYEFIKQIFLNSFNADLLRNDLKSLINDIEKIKTFELDKDFEVSLEDYSIVVGMSDFFAKMNQASKLVELDNTIAKISEMKLEIESALSEVDSRKKINLEEKRQQLNKLFITKDLLIGQISNDIEEKACLGFNKAAANDYLTLSQRDPQALHKFHKKMFADNGDVLDTFARPLEEWLNSAMKQIGPTWLKKPAAHFFGLKHIVEIYVPNATTLTIQAVNAELKNSYLDRLLLSETLEETYYRLGQDISSPFQWARERWKGGEINTPLSRNGILILIHSFLKLFNLAIWLFPKKYQDKAKQSLQFASIGLQLESYNNALMEVTKQLEAGKFSANFPILVFSILRSLADLGFYCLHYDKASTGDDIENPAFYRFERSLSTFMDWVGRIMLLSRLSSNNIILGLACVFGTLHTLYDAFISDNVSDQTLGAFITNYLSKQKLGIQDDIKFMHKIPAMLSSFGMTLKYDSNKQSNTAENYLRIRHLELQAQDYYNSKDFASLIELTRVNAIRDKNNLVSIRMSQQHQVPLHFVWNIAIYRLRAHSDSRETLIKFRNSFQRNSKLLFRGQERINQENWDNIEDELIKEVKYALLKYIITAYELYNENKKDRIKSYLSKISKDYNFCPEWWYLIESPRTMFKIGYLYFRMNENSRAQRFLAHISSSDWEKFLTDEKNQDCIQEAKEIFEELDINQFRHEALIHLLEKHDKRLKTHKSIATLNSEIIHINKLWKQTKKNPEAYPQQFFNKNSYQKKNSRTMNLTIIPCNSKKQVTIDKQRIIEENFQARYKQISRVSESAVSEDIAKLTSHVMSFVRRN